MVDGRGWIFWLDSGFRGLIEFIFWDDLILDVWDRNKVFFDKVGILGKSFFEFR